MTMAKLKIKTGDTVLVISGEDKGKKGQVKKVIPEKQKAIVEGVRVVTKHIKPTQQNPEGGRTTKESPVHISNLMLIDPKTDQPTRVGRKPKEENGQVKLARYSKKTQEFID